MTIFLVYGAARSVTDKGHRCTLTAVVSDRSTAALKAPYIPFFRCGASWCVRGGMTCCCVVIGLSAFLRVPRLHDPSEASDVTQPGFAPMKMNDSDNKYL